MKELMNFVELTQDFKAVRRKIVLAKEEREESKFVNALDKILPIINIYLDKGHSWKEHRITFDDLIDNKKDKVAISPIIKKYFDEIVVLLKKNQSELFSL